MVTAFTLSDSPGQVDVTAKVTELDFFPSYERYERHETPSPPQQRQQRTLRRQQTSIASDPDVRSGRSTPSSQRILRRTPRFLGTPSPQPQVTPPRRTHLEAVSVGISPGALFANAPADNLPTQEEPAQRRRPRRPRQLSQDLISDTEASTTLPPSFIPPRTSSSPRADTTTSHPVLHISRHTHSAILWALEEALRHPNPFTPDLIEENASMADILGGSGQPAVTNGVGSSTTKPTAPPVQTGSPSRGIRGPRMIMQERQAREERQRAERENMERARAEAEARLMEDQNRRMAERRQPAAGATTSGGAAGNEGLAPIPTQPLDLSGSQRRQRQAAEAQSRQTHQPSSGVQQPAQPSQQRTSRTSTAQATQPLQFSGVPTNTGGAGAGLGPGFGSTTAGPAGDTSGAARGQPRNSFPHAFERWEALSAHWEGLTSFWIRKLQQHSEEIDRDPVSAQLSRQVSDLSAAGANLFHAVVELQRLRASSERKFQRWFFETREQLERSQEATAMLEAQLQEERRSKATAIQEALNNDRANSKTQKRITEMQKELTISKEEARRAWEELGRYSQEERDRTASLQSGQPTIVGGVQVVPMTQGVGRPSGARESRSAQQQPQSEVSSHVPSQQYPQYTQPTQAQPILPTAAGPSSAGGSYQQSKPAGRGERAYSAGGESEGGYSEGEYVIDAQGNFLRDSRGDKIPYASPGTPGDDGSDSGADDYETPMNQPGVSYPPSSSQWAGQQQSGQPDYSGADFAAPGWETMTRHHHPTRLSDVMEEDDERSRTSAGHSHFSRP